MHNSITKKPKTIMAIGLLICLSTLCSVPEALLEMSPLIGTSGKIAYTLNAILLVTDSTPEGPVPFKIDNQQSYQTGRTYNLTAGSHTIELPSPYVVGAVIYYFSQWDDGNTQNPRTITLVANVPYALDGIYVTTPPSQFYKVTIAAWSYSTGQDPTMLIIRDGVLTTYTTPYTFSDIPNGEIHTYRVPEMAGTVPFNRWSSGSTTLEIAVSSGGSYTAYYGKPPQPTGFLAYTGWERFGSGTTWTSTVSPWNPWDSVISNPPFDYVKMAIDQSPASVQIVSYASQGLPTLPNGNGGSNVIRLNNGKTSAASPLIHTWNNRGTFYTDIYESKWLYFPSAFVNEIAGTYTSFGGFDESPYEPWWSAFYMQIEGEGWLLLGGHPLLGNQAELFKYTFTENGVYPHSLTGSGSGYTGHVPWAKNVTVNTFGIPRDRWFRMEYYLHRAADNTGIFKWWVTDPNHPDPLKRAPRLIFSIEGIKTVRDSGWVQNFYKFLQLRYTNSYYYSDELYFYDYNAHQGQ